MKNTYSTSINATAFNSYILSVVKDNYSTIVKYDSVADYFIEYINNNETITDLLTYSELNDNENAKDILKYYLAENFPYYADYYVHENISYERVLSFDDSMTTWIRDSEVLDDANPDYFKAVLETLSIEFEITEHYLYVENGGFEKACKFIAENKTQFGY